MRPMLNYGAVDTEALSGAHAGFWASSLRKSQDIALYRKMKLHLRPAQGTDFAFCETLTRTNMASYRSTRGIAWDPDRYLATWARFESFVILVDGQPAGLLQLLMVDGALEIRDLQLARMHQGLGIGTRAVNHAKSEAAKRGIDLLRLRVYPENPARCLYARLGFTVDAMDGCVVHMSHALSPDAFSTTGQPDSGVPQPARPRH